MEGIAVKGFFIEESSVGSEFLAEVSFGDGVAKIKQKEDFNEGDRMVTLSPLLGIFDFGALVDDEVESGLLV